MESVVFWNYRVLTYTVISFLFIYLFIHFTDIYYNYYFLQTLNISHVYTVFGFITINTTKLLLNKCQHFTPSHIGLCLHCNLWPFPLLEYLCGRRVTLFIDQKGFHIYSCDFREKMHTNCGVFKLRNLCFYWVDNVCSLRMKKLLFSKPPRRCGIIGRRASV